jgi:hypothetical protein
LIVKDVTTDAIRSRQLVGWDDTEDINMKAAAKIRTTASLVV